MNITNFFLRKQSMCYFSKLLKYGPCNFHLLRISMCLKAFLFQDQFLKNNYLLIKPKVLGTSHYNNSITFKGRDDTVDVNIKKKY